MRAVPKAPEPPYPYPYPLPDEARRTHLAATKAAQRRIAKLTGFLLMPGVVALVITAVWGNGRSSGPHDWSLWATAPAVAVILLVAGLALIGLATVEIVRATRVKGGHMRLLRAYHVRLDQLGREITPR